MIGPEKIVELEIEAGCTAAGCLVRRLKLVEGRGWPDLSIFGNGRVVFVEVKEPGGGTVSENQKLIHEDLIDAGIVVYVATSAKIVKEILRALEMS